MNVKITTYIIEEELLKKYEVNELNNFICKHQIKKISIDPSVLNDHEMLEDLLIVAFKDALQKIEQTTNAKMGTMLPPGMKLPF